MQIQRQTFPPARIPEDSAFGITLRRTWREIEDDVLTESDSGKLGELLNELIENLGNSI